MAEAIQAFAGRVNTFLDEIGASVDGVQGDVTELKRLIKQLQDSAGGVTPEDQATIDALESRISGLAAKTKTLDEQTENVPTPG
jgi:ABC-type transporter Mla subunit MlaD